MNSDARRTPGVERRVSAVAVKRELLRQLGPWGSSAAFHAVAIVMLLMWTIPIMQRGSVILTAFTGIEEDDSGELSFAMVEQETHPELPADESELSPPVLLAQTEVELSTDPQLDVTEDLAEVGLVASQAEESETLATDKVFQVAAATSAVSGARSVEEAVDRVTGGIRGRLDEGDLLVVWMLDASLSLKDDRPRVAARLGSFLSEIAESADQRPYVLLSAVVAFGRGIEERTSPTKSVKAVLRAIETTPIDTSGKESTFVSIEKCVAQYRKRWKSQLMIVVWTDESGDDTDRLEKTIARCRKADVAVSVVGPSAVLGSDTGLHAYRDPQTQLIHQLPVTRGPDAAMPERLRLGYWFRGRLPPSVPRGSVSPYPSWYGGPDLQGLSSGFSPYALTRLTLQTGGGYTVFDRPEDKGPFDVDRMQDYFPEYDSVAEYAREIESYPLRKAVMQAVRVTRSKDIETPDFTFFGQRSLQPPYNIEALFLTPAQFRQRLRSVRARLLRGARNASYTVEKALAHLSKAGRLEEGLDYEYEHEPSLRWRGWYDLTRGRLLAISVRLEEYRIVCERFQKQDWLRANTNGVMLLPATQMRSAEPYTTRASQAERLLTRCVEDHADTPWAYLADRELVHGLGIQVRQLTLQPTGELNPTQRTRLPNF